MKRTPDPDKVKPTPILRMPERPAVGAGEGSVRAQKSAARLAAVQILYQMQVNNQPAPDAVREFLVHRVGYTLDGDVFVPAQPQLLQDIVHGVDARSADIDGILRSALSEGGRTEVELILDAILRCGVFELLSHGDIDAGIIINDYLNVTTAFYDGKEAKLVNAILDRVAKTVRG